MKYKVFAFIFICGYLIIYCNGEDYSTESTLSSSIDTTTTKDDISSTHSIISTDSSSFTDSESTTENVSAKNFRKSNLDGSSTNHNKDLTATASTLLPVITDKRVIVNDVVKKICALAKKSLRYAKKEDRPIILKKIELKLRKASHNTGNTGKPYVDIIMNGIKNMVRLNDYSVCDKDEHKEDDVVNAPPDLSTSTSTTPKIEVAKPNVTVSPKPLIPIARSQNDIVREKLFKSMVEKLESIAKKSFKNATKPEEKMIILEKIKKKLLNVMKNNNETLKSVNTSYADLILKGIKWIMNKDPRRMTFDFADNNNKEKERREPPIMFLKEADETSKSTLYPQLISSAGMTTEYDCSAIQKKICKSINQLNEFICSYDDTVISVERICDGHVDCPDGSDEKNCVKQAIARTHNATEIVKDVGLAKNCLFPLMDNSMFSNQAKMMTEVLKNEIHFINKYTKLNPSRSEKEKFRELDHRSLKDLSSDVCFLVRSFVIAMDGALCTDTLQSVDEMVKKLSEPIDRAITEDDTPLKDFKMKICDCNGPFCSNITCPSGCRRICYQRNSLMQLTCRATDGSNGVTLDLICDGKFDCYDETDETGCILYNSAGKFEANKIYDSVLKTIRTILGHFGFEMARSQLGQLHDTIRTLQIKSINPKSLNEEFKKFRNKAFKLIVEIYDETLNSVAVELKAESTFDYLESIKEKLIVALKKTFTGNKKIIAPDGCFCRGLECALPVCSRKCVRTCISKPKLTRYLCTSTNSTSIPIEQICNGKKNCPKGEDEDRCRPELCRRQHVVALRAKLAKVGDKHAGTVLGEVLKNWRVKALANLLVLENQERPTAQDFKVTMSEMLEHLVVGYATLEDYRRFKSGTLILNKFEKLAQKMMESLKACSNSGFVYPGGPRVQ